MILVGEIKPHNESQSVYHITKVEPRFFLVLKNDVIKSISRTLLMRHCSHRLLLLFCLLLLRLLLRKHLSGQMSEVIYTSSLSVSSTARRDQDFVVLSNVHNKGQTMEAVADIQTFFFANTTIVETGNLRQTISLLFVVWR